MPKYRKISLNFSQNFVPAEDLAAGAAVVAAAGEREGLRTGHARVRRQVPAATQRAAAGVSEAARREKTSASGPCRSPVRQPLVLRQRRRPGAHHPGALPAILSLGRNPQPREAGEDRAAHGARRRGAGAEEGDGERAPGGLEGGAGVGDAVARHVLPLHHVQPHPHAQVRRRGAAGNAGAADQRRERDGAGGWRAWVRAHRDAGSMLSMAGHLKLMPSGPSLSNVTCDNTADGGRCERRSPAERTPASGGAHRARPLSLHGRPVQRHGLGWQGGERRAQGG